MRRYIRVLAFILAFMGTIAMMGICAYAAEEETPADDSSAVSVAEEVSDITPARIQSKASAETPVPVEPPAAEETPVQTPVTEPSSETIAAKGSEEAAGVPLPAEEITNEPKPDAKKQPAALLRDNPSGELVIEGGVEGTDYFYEGDTVTFLRNGSYIVSMREGVSETAHQIVINRSEELSDITLTLNNLKLNTEGDSNITANVFPKDGELNLTLILQGDNTLSAGKEPFRSNYNLTNTTIKGSGTLTVNTTGSDPHESGWNGSSFTLESGTVTFNTTGITNTRGIYINGGTLNVNCTFVPCNGALYTNGVYKQTGGTVNIDSVCACLFIVGVKNDTTPGMEVLGGDLNMKTSATNIPAVYAGNRYQKDVIIDTDGTVSIDTAGIGIYLNKNSDLTMNNGILRITNSVYGIYATQPGSDFFVNGGETEVTSSTRAILLNNTDAKRIQYGDSYFHKNYDGEKAASRQEVSDSDILDKNGLSKKYVLITPAYRISYDLGNGRLPQGSSNPVKYSRVDNYTLVNPLPNGSGTFTGWTGTGISGQTMSVTIPEGSKGDRTYTANYTYPVDPGKDDGPSSDDGKQKAGGNKKNPGNAATGNTTPVVAITDPETPMAAPDVSEPSVGSAVIADPETPLSDSRYWALLNLILMAITAILGAALLVRYFFRRDDGEDEDTNRNGGKLLGLIPGIGSIILFILTEDMSLPMQITDKWTIPMALILAVQIGIAVFSKNRSASDA